MSGKRAGVSDLHRTTITGRTVRLIHRPGVCGGPSCAACEAEQEIAERNER